jgi:DNA polymerase III alpha subunit (gram-positive type)
VKYLIFDTETGGFSPEEDALLSVGAILLDDNLEEINRFYTVLKNDSDKKISEYARDVNKITDELIDAGMPVEEFKEKWNNLIEDVDILIAHNTKFDINFLKGNGIKVIDRVFDTMHMAWDIWPGQKAKLGMIFERIGLEVENAHNAMYDCEMTADFLRWAVKEKKLRLPITSFPLVENYFEKSCFGYKKMIRKGLIVFENGRFELVDVEKKED